MRTLLILLLAAGVARSETTLVLEAAESLAGPWVVVPIGPEALDLKGGIAWDAFPERFQLVRLRLVQDGRDVTADYVARPVQLGEACECDACTGVQ
jgi:hypothetical protein